MTPVTVVHLTTVHRVDDARIFHRQCVSLAAAGHAVVLVAPHDRPEQRGGVAAVPLPRYRNRLARMVLGGWRAWRAASSIPADVYHIHDPELLPVALALIRSGRAVVYDAHEDVTATAPTKSWLPVGTRRLAGRLARWLERAVARRGAGIVAATEHIARSISAEAVVVANYPDLHSFSAPAAPRDPLVAYVGGLTEARGIGDLVDAMAQVPADLGARLALAGRFEPPSYEQQLRRRAGWERVDFHGWLESDEVATLLGQAAIGVAPLHPLPNHVRSSPIKLFEYMAAGAAVIASDFPGWRHVVAGSGCGELVPPADPGALGAAITALLRDPPRAAAMGRRGRHAVETRYHWSSQLANLVGVYERVR